MNERPYTRIYLSPHLDDVIYSCGATLHRQVRAGERVLVASFYAGSPPDDSMTDYTRELGERWGGVSDPVAVRRREDLAALRVLGAEALHLPFLDCVYRRDQVSRQALYPTEESIFGPVHRSESRLPGELMTALLDRLGEAGNARQVTLYAPIGAGQHVDHLLVRGVGLLLLQAGRRVLFYEDYPYSTDAQAVEAARSPWSSDCWRAQAVYFSEKDLRAKIAAAGCYVSQISTFWASLEEMGQALRAQALAVGGDSYGERLWELSAECPVLAGPELP